MKRLKSLDAMRGIALLGMIPFHMLLFGILWISGTGEWGTTGGISAELFVVEFEKPIATGLILFFFVTGISLTLSIARRREEKGIWSALRRVILRYGGYFVAGLVFEGILFLLLSEGQVNLLELIPIILTGATFSGPIIGISLTAIAALPLILYLSWKKLAAAALILAPIVGFALYYFLLPMAASLPQYTPLNPIIIEYYAVLKALPMMLAGAAIGKLVLEGRDLKKRLFLVGFSITVAYMVIPTLLGSMMLHMVLAVWAYPHAIIFTVGSGLAAFGLFQFLEARKINLSALTVVGRSALPVYYGHFILFFMLFMAVGPENLSMASLGGLILLVIATVWILCYFYSKQRWGTPSSW